MKLNIHAALITLLCILAFGGLTILFVYFPTLIFYIFLSAITSGLIYLLFTCIKGYLDYKFFDIYND